MIRALTNSASGLEAQSANIERISNDLANVNTDAYKRERTEFQDLMYQTIHEPGAPVGAESQSPVGYQKGLGVKVGANYKIFEQGPAKITNHPYDLLIQGRGFLPVQMVNGQVGYTRSGAFHLDSEGRLVLSSGASLIPEITIPNNASEILISPSGEVKARTPAEGEFVIGQIQLVAFQNEQGLMAQGEGIYRPSGATGAPVQGVPGENGFGRLQQGALEGSNVNVPNSMVEMISTQRAYELNAKAIKALDEMLGMTANLK